MGYTHYYYQTKTFPQKKWESLALDTFKIVEYCKKCDIDVDFECDSQKEPEISDTMIRFNGRGNEGHETFILFKQKPKSESWQRNSKEYFYFCKTARKPYDVAVGLVLLRAEKNAPGVLKVSSDGDWEHDWTDIQDAYRKVFEDEPVCPFVQETV
jgi:hypothetical protein